MPPSHSMVPLSGCRFPETMFIKVLLPAPFSPSNASTWLGKRSRLTSCNASTPAKVFEILRSDNSGGSAGAFMQAKSRSQELQEFRSSRMWRGVSKLLMVVHSPFFHVQLLFTNQPFQPL